MSGCHRLTSAIDQIQTFPLKKFIKRNQTQTTEKMQMA